MKVTVVYKSPDTKKTERIEAWDIGYVMIWAKMLKQKGATK